MEMQGLLRLEREEQKIGLKLASRKMKNLNIRLKGLPVRVRLPRLC